MFAILLASTLAAPVPKAKDPALYFPVKEGARRVMERTHDGRTVETVETVTKVVSQDGNHTVTVEVGRDRATGASEFVVSSKGVFRTPFGGDEPTPEFQPARGDTWTTAGTDGDKSTSTVGAEEEVKVPAGTFKAIPVVTEMSVGKLAYTYTTWFAPGVGGVKVVMTGPRSEEVQVLKEFTPGK
jgi:hypothetical protein